MVGGGDTPGGLVVPVGASDEMALAIGSLLADETFRIRLGAGLKERVNKHYRAEVIAEAYAQLYERNLNATARRGL